MSTQKIITIATLKRKLSVLRNKRKKIAFTNGCFDILHNGHVSYLQKAKAKDRILVLGLNSDKSVRRIKGPKRPIVNEKDRASILAALECVDYVVIFNEDTPLKLIAAVKPDILIKGADWKGKGIVGEDVVRAHGGKIEYVKFVKDKSTTNIVKRILKIHRAQTTEH